MTGANDQLIQSLPLGREMRYRQGEVISSPHSPANFVFRVKAGKARLYLVGAQREQTIGYLTKHSIFVSHAPLWIEATELCEIITWPLQELRHLIEAEADFALLALREVGQLLQGSIEMIEGLALHSVTGRLARYLLAERSKQQSDVIELIGSVEVLASFLGTSRQTLSTQLNQLFKSGILERADNGHVHIKSASELTQICNGLSDS